MSEVVDTANHGNERIVTFAEGSRPDIEIGSEAEPIDEEIIVLNESDENTPTIVVAAPNDKHGLINLGPPTMTTPVIAGFIDHFSLPIPSSRIRFRANKSAARVIEQQDSQFVLEENYDEETDVTEISIKSIKDTSEGVRFLRSMYAIVTLFWTGFLFILSLQILLFLVLDLAITLGITSRNNPDIKASIGVIFSFPAFVYGLASAMVIAGAFVVDTWKGHFLIRTFTFRGINSVVVEWIFFAAFLGLPLFVMACMMLSGNDNWWTYTGL
jgi:hypothetical protein